MVRTNVNNNENILVKVDQNNLIYIDPNSVVDKKGEVSPRGIQQENLVIYVNLEADIVPRSILASQNDKNTLLSISKGTLNFLRNQTGKDYDTTWTNAFNGSDQEANSDKTLYNINNTKFDNSGQSFGMDTIQVAIKGANFIPQVTITFIDVRGKTLFESPENSPYNAFFHIPWPIFYLTIKGFYGKAIRYRLHLVKFNSRFNETTGNFEINTTFVGSTYAHLTDIPLKGVLNAPYMYMVENTSDSNVNTNKDTSQRKVSRSSRGYATLAAVYAEYKRKGLIPKDFPVKTLRELIVGAMTLDKILEKEITDQLIDGRLFVGLKEYENTITEFQKAIDSWAQVNLLRSPITPSVEIAPGVSINYYELSGTNKADKKKIYGKDELGSLERILELYKEQLEKSSLFAKEITRTGDIDFKNETILKGRMGTINKYVRIDNDQYQVGLEVIIKDLSNLYNVYDSQKQKLVSLVEKKMNEFIKDKTHKQSIGFDPTIRNVFAVILANADTYVRLLKDVHRNAFERSEERKKKIANLSSEGDQAIYPWPEIKKNAAGEKQKVIAYPGEKDLIGVLGSDNMSLWPEVDFVENYIEVSTNKVDTNSDKELGEDKLNFIFDFEIDLNNLSKITSLSVVMDIVPYIDQSPSSYLYEIYERSSTFTLFESFNVNSLRELALAEFKNVKETVKENDELIAILGQTIYSGATYPNGSPMTETVLRDLLASYSPFERYPYYQDQLATTSYIKNSIDSSHIIEPYQSKEVLKSVSESNTSLTQEQSENKKEPVNEFKNLTNNLINYVPESYRKNIYPFNSSTYLSYLNTTNFTDDEFKFQGVLSIDLAEGFIISPINSKDWVKPEYLDSANPILNNIFKQKITINDTKVNILNTPYFHKQLYSDFSKVSAKGKYVGSAYLLLNSLPFYDLEDKIKFTGFNNSVRMSSLFREIGATHFIPYHLMVKWGSIYHRYKTYLLDEVDILDGFLNTGNTTTDIDGNLFFNNNETGSTFNSYTITPGTDVTFTNQTDVGIHPFYDAIYHQVLNDYAHYDIQSGNTSFSANTQNGVIYERNRYESNGLKYWTGFVDNSKFNTSDLRYTLLPSDGGNQFINRKLSTILLPILGNNTTTTIISDNETFESGTQNNFRVLWYDDQDYINDDFSGKTFPSYEQYHRTYNETNRTYDNLYSIGENYRKVLDLIATFSPQILEDFENMFLDFSTERVVTETDWDNNSFPSVKHKKFQDLLNEISTVEKQTNDLSEYSVEELIETIKLRQWGKLRQVTNDILSESNLIKLTLGNPKEINPNVWYGFAKVDDINRFSVNEFYFTQTGDTSLNYINLYLGEDIDGYYLEFFLANNIEFSEDNILLFRPLILIYGGYRKAGNPADTDTFKQYIKTNVFVKDSDTSSGVGGSSSRLSDFLFNLTREFRTLKVDKKQQTYKITSGYNNEVNKIELYNYFKSFNDKWIAGNSLGQRLFLEEFLFLDKANKDIGDKLYLNLDRLIPLADAKNDKLDLYSAISTIIAGTGVDMRALPAYVNFYGTNLNNKAKITPSKKVAQNIFGTYLDVDYQESSPRIVLQLVGPSSKHLADTDKKNYKFFDDSFNLSSVNNNPLVVTTPEVFNTGDLYKSNRVIAFEVSFGDQNQGIFKSVQLDQSSLKNTSESFVVLENLAKSESGAGAYNVDIGLFNYYRQASYTCEVSMMGDVMIQPTMFFYLKNIPMFRGSYWITEVNHNIRNGSIVTSFKGTRIPYASLPDPKDSFTSSYRVLFDKIMQRTIARIENEKKNRTETTISIEADGHNYTTDPGSNIQGEDLPNNIVKLVGLTPFYVPFNGASQEKYIQKVKYNFDGETEWLRSRVVEYGTTNYPLEDNIDLLLITFLDATAPMKWGEAKGCSETHDFYSTKFQIPNKDRGIIEQIRGANTIFLNPNNKKTVSVSSSLTGGLGSRKVTGPVGTGPAKDGYGVAMSKSLMKKLDLHDGDVVYFVMK